MGAAGDDSQSQEKESAFVPGQAIGRRDFVLITGACSGLPFACARGARDQGGLSVGISPALGLDEYVHNYLSPSDAFDVLIFTGSGLMGREVTDIHPSDMVLILGGRSGSLGEVAIAYDEGKLIGVLEVTGGITERIPGHRGELRQGDRRADTVPLRSLGPRPAARGNLRRSTAGVRRASATHAGPRRRPGSAIMNTSEERE